MLADCQALPPSESTGIILGGDFFCDPALKKRGGFGDVRDIWKAFGHAFGWVVGVAGNHDSFGGYEIPDSLSRSVLLDRDICERNSLRIGGISGVVGNPRKRRRTSEDDFIQNLERLTEKSPDILVLHEGPSIPEIGAKGNDNIRSRLDSVRNNLIVICGHTHWPRVFYQISENVQAINTDFRVVIITDTEIKKI